MSCANITINSKDIRTQALYVPCTGLNRPNYSGNGITDPALLMAALVAKYQGSTLDFEIIAGVLYLRLPCRDSDYKPEYIYPFDEPQFNRSMAIQTYRIRTYSYQFTARVGDDRAWLYYLIEEIRRSTLSADLKIQSPLIIIDAVLPDQKDFLASIQASSNPYTSRKGILKPVKPVTGSSGRGSKRAMPGGFEFTFEELELKI